MRKNEIREDIRDMFDQHPGLKGGLDALNDMYVKATTEDNNAQGFGLEYGFIDAKTGKAHYITLTMKATPQPDSVISQDEQAIRNSAEYKARRAKFESQEGDDTWQIGI